MSSIQAIKSYIRETLKNVSDAPELEAEFILSHTLPPNLIPVAAHLPDTIPNKTELAIRAIVEKRASGTPLAYVLGEWDFYGRTFTVSDKVLVPRPSTEALIEAALPIILRLSEKEERALHVSDIGTGSGAIAITLLLEAPTHIAQVTATDISASALEIAEQNAVRHGVRHKIAFQQGPMLEPLRDIATDLIVSNPPYVPSAELQKLTSRETIGLQFEPRIALDGGTDGLAYIKQLTTTDLPLIYEGLQGGIFTRNV